MILITLSSSECRPSSWYLFFRLVPASLGHVSRRYYLIGTVCDVEDSRNLSPAALEGRDPSPAADEDPDLVQPHRPRTAASNVCEIV